MKTRSTPLLACLLGTGLFAAGLASAQTQSQPMQQATPPTQGTTTTSPTQSNPAGTAPSQGNPAGTTSPSQSNPAGSSGGNSATYNTSQGQLTVNSTMGSAPSTASPPSFEQLANGKKYISKEDANAFPPLANDFEYAAHHGNRISKAQYENWLKHLN